MTAHRTLVVMVRTIWRADQGGLRPTPFFAREGEASRGSATGRVTEMTRYPRFVILFVIFIVSMMLGFPLPFAQSQTDIIELIPNTAILLDQSSGSGSGGNATSPSSTNTFSPPSFVDYKSFCGEPTGVFVPYPFTTPAQCAPHPPPPF